jgi:hypothetical protein
MRSYDAELRQVNIRIHYYIIMITNSSRCAKRNKPDQCVYHPAPLTKAATPQDTSDSESPRVNSFSTLYQSPLTCDVTSETYYPDPKRVKRTGDLQSVHRLDIGSEKRDTQRQQAFEELHKPLLSDSSQVGALGFDDSAGFISHSAILAENELSVGIQPSNDGMLAISKVSQSQIDRGATVLTLLSDISTIQKYIDK